MSLPLPCISSLRISFETRAWLDSEMARTGQDQCAVIREILHAHAVREIDAAKLLLGCVEATIPGEGVRGGHRSA